MKKNIYGRQFKRDINERKALFKSLMTSLVIHDRIQTTEEKAKAIKASVEKLVTKAKIKGLKAVPQLLPYLREDAVKRIINDIAPRFTNRPGGYTRIIKLGRRFGDDASIVVMEWVEGSSKLKIQNSKLDKSIRTENLETTAKGEKSKSTKLHKQPKTPKKKTMGTKVTNENKEKKTTKKGKTK